MNVPVKIYTYKFYLYLIVQFSWVVEIKVRSSLCVTALGLCEPSSIGRVHRAQMDKALQTCLYFC